MHAPIHKHVFLYQVIAKMHSNEAPSVTNAELHVPKLGHLTGITLNEQMCQDLGIPYGEVPGRFRRAVAAPTPWKDGRHDGTKFGCVFVTGPTAR